MVSERDPDTSFTVKNDETYFGYKAHLAVDEESGFVRQAEMTSADLHDSQRGEAMIQGDEAAYYADKAYDGQALRGKLGEVCYLGLDRNNCHLQFVAMAMNMKRARLLIAAP